MGKDTKWFYPKDTKWFHPAHYNVCNYWSRLGLNLIHVSKRGPRGQNTAFDFIKHFGVMLFQNIKIYMHFIGCFHTTMAWLFNSGQRSPYSKLSVLLLIWLYDKQQHQQPWYRPSYIEWYRLCTIKITFVQQSVTVKLHISWIAITWIITYFWSILNECTPVSCTVCIGTGYPVQHLLLWVIILGLLDTWDLVYWHGWTLILAWISNYIHYNVWDEITYPLPNFNGGTVEIWEWIRNFIPHFTGNVITYPCWD